MKPAQYLHVSGVLAQIRKLVPDPGTQYGSVVALGLLDWLLTDGLSHSHGTMALIYLSMTAVVLLVQLLLLGEVLGVVLWYSGALKKVAPGLCTCRLQLRPRSCSTSGLARAKRRPRRHGYGPGGGSTDVRRAERSRVANRARQACPKPPPAPDRALDPLPPPSWEDDGPVPPGLAGYPPARPHPGPGHVLPRGHGCRPGTRPTARKANEPSGEMSHTSASRPPPACPPPVSPTPALHTYYPGGAGVGRGGTPGGAKG